MEITITTNIDNVRDYLGFLPQKIRDNLVVAVKKSALTVERYEKQEAPVDTGRLRSSIVSSIHPMSATIGPYVFYAIFVNEGTKFINANPFVYRSMQSADSEVNQFFDEAITDAIK